MAAFLSRISQIARCRLPNVHPSFRAAWIAFSLSFLLLVPSSSSQTPANPFQENARASAKLTPTQIHRLTLAVKEAPKSFPAHMNLGIALAESGHWQPALRQFDAARRIDPDNPDAIYNRGLTYLMMARANPDRRSIVYYHQLDAAQRALSHALALNPHLANIHEHLGRLYHLIGDQDSATQQFRIGVEIEPESSQALNNLGTSLAGTGRYKEAIDCYEKALVIDLECTSCLLNLESAIRRQGTSMDALKRYRTQAQSPRDSARAHLLYGMILTVFHNQQQLATIELRSALHSVPNLAAAHFYLGNLARQQQNNVTAEAEYRMAIQMAPGRVEFLKPLATVLLEENKTKDAEATLQEALTLDPENASLHYKYSQVLRRLGQTQRAAHEQAETARLEKVDQQQSQLETSLRRGIEDLRSEKAADAVQELRAALALSPNHPETNFYLGIALSQTGDTVGSSEAFKRALERRPESAEFHYNFGIALWKSGQSSRAIEQFRRTASIRPDDALNLCALGIALLQSGNSEGQKDISRAQELGACTSSRR